MGNFASWGGTNLPTLLITAGWALVLIGSIVLARTLSQRRAANQNFRGPKDVARVPARPPQRVAIPDRERGTIIPPDRDLETRKFQYPNQYPNRYPNDNRERHQNLHQPPRSRLPSMPRPRFPITKEQPGRREVLGLGAMLLGSATLWGVDRQQEGLLPIIPAPPKDGVLNLKDFGAVGDGQTDDGPALRRALDALEAQGGGTLYLPTGIYQCSAVPQGHSPDPHSNWCGRIPGNSHIIGAGAGSTILRLAPNSPNQAWMLTNYHLAAPVDTNITVEHLTIDGNAAQQSAKTDGQLGLVFVRVQGITVRNVVFKDLYGRSSGKPGPSGTPGENFHTDCKGCTDIVYSDCRIESNPKVPCGSGFSLNGSSRATYTNCTATGLKFGQGYTHWQSKDITYVNCRVFNCGQDGFHSEHSDMLTYTACFSGATWLANQGNLQHQVMTKGNAIGFNIYYGTRVQIAHCISRGNAASGVKIEQSSGVSILGGIFTENAEYGLRLQDSQSAAGTTLGVRPNLNGNKKGPLWFIGQLTPLTGRLDAPAVPASSKTISNPFPFAVTVYLTGGSVDGVTLNDIDLGKPSGALVLRAGGTIKIAYSAAPGWVWLAD